jgi:hypothetical protein
MWAFNLILLLHTSCLCANFIGTIWRQARQSSEENLKVCQKAEYFITSTLLLSKKHSFQ